MLNKTVLVTGGAGFIGKHTSRVMLREGFEVITADRKPKPANIDCRHYQIDVSTENLYKIFEENNIDYIIHLAALPSVAESIKMPLSDCRDNYQSAVNVCCAAKKYGIKKIIFSSTAAVYANPEYLPVDEKHPNSFLSPYAITKNASENFIKYSGLDYIIFRYANVYGPEQDAFGEAGVIAKFFDLMLKDKTIQIHGNGGQFRDFIYVSDIAEANLLALKSDIKNEIINVSTNKSTSINELFQIMKETLNYKLEPEYTNKREGDIEKSILDNRKLISLLNFTPSIDVREGIKKRIRMILL